MQKVISINLRGNAYQLEEKGYTLLENYLEEARKSLKQDPDKEEVMHDFEQAIADKCDQLLSEHKTVVTTTEMQKIIKAMGPVEAVSEADEPQPTEATQEPIKKLYTLQDGAIIGGVCSGLGAYFNIDVVIVRLAFIILALFTFGFSILLYLALMLFTPEAKTPEQKAQLRGQKFNAQAVIDRAKQKYSEVSQYPSWKGQANSPALTNVGEGIVKLLRVLATVSSVLLGIVAVWLTVTAFVLIWSVTSGSIVLHETLRSIPLWQVNMAQAAAYVIAIIPVTSMMYSAYKYGRNQPVPKTAHRLGLATGILWTIAVTAFICVIVTNVDQLRDFEEATRGTSQVIQEHVRFQDGSAVRID